MPEINGDLARYVSWRQAAHPAYKVFEEEAIIGRLDFTYSDKTANIYLFDRTRAFNAQSKVAIGSQLL